MAKKKKKKNSHGNSSAKTAFSKVRSIAFQYPEIFKEKEFNGRINS